MGTQWVLEPGAFWKTLSKDDTSLFSAAKLQFKQSLSVSLFFKHRRVLKSSRFLDNIINNSTSVNDWQENGTEEDFESKDLLIHIRLYAHL